MGLLPDVGAADDSCAHSLRMVTDLDALDLARGLVRRLTDTRSSPATETKQYLPSLLDCDQ